MAIVTDLYSSLEG